MLYVIQVCWHIPLLCVQWKTPDDGQRNSPKLVEFYSKNKFEKLVHLDGFIIRMYPMRFLSFRLAKYIGKIQTHLRKNMLVIIALNKSCWTTVDLYVLGFYTTQQVCLTCKILQVIINRLTPNDPYMGRTAPLTSKRWIYLFNTYRYWIF